MPGRDRDLTYSIPRCCQCVVPIASLRAYLQALKACSVSQAAKKAEVAEIDNKSSWRGRRLKPLVAFSSGPYAACLADGSEYTGSYVDKTTFEQLVDFHRRKLQASLSSFDELLFTTALRPG